MTASTSLVATFSPFHLQITAPWARLWAKDQTQSPEGVPSSILKVVISKLVLNQNVARVEIQVAQFEHVPQQFGFRGLFIGVSSKLTMNLIPHHFPNQKSWFVGLASDAATIRCSDRNSGVFVAPDQNNRIHTSGINGHKSHWSRSVVDVNWVKLV